MNTLKNNFELIKLVSVKDPFAHFPSKISIGHDWNSSWFDVPQRAVVITLQQYNNRNELT